MNRFLTTDNFLKIAPFGIGVVKGPTHIWQTANPKMVELAGRSHEEELLGKPMFEAIPESRGQGFEAILDIVFTTGKQMVLEEIPIEIKRFGKTERIFFKTTYEPIKEADGSVSGILIILDDVSTLAKERRKIKQSEDRFNRMMEQAPVSICVLRGENFRIEIANKIMLSTFNKTWEEIKGKTFFEAFPDASSINNEGLIRVYFTGETLVTNEVPLIVWQNGVQTTLYLNIVYKPLMITNDEIDGIIIMSTDVTETVSSRWLVEKSKQRFMAAVKAVNGVLWTNNALGEMEGEQPAWSALTGQSYDEYRGFGWANAVHPDDAQATVDAWNAAVKERRIFLFDHRLKSSKNGYRYFSIKAIPVFEKDGSISEWVGVHTDIQHEKEFTHELELQVLERTREIAQKSRALENMNSNLESFARVASHDLQEPLRKIQTFTSMILEEDDKILSPTGKKYFDRIQNASERMQTLIKDLIAFTKPGELLSTFERTDLNKIVKLVLDDLKEEVEQKQAVIEVGVLCEFDIIPYQFRQLLTNIISNGLKFSKNGEAPHISIISKEVKGSEVKELQLKPEQLYCHLTISDKGIGFEQTYSEKIFEVFQRLHSKAGYIGNGIGLSIVKKIVENHDGYIFATSEPGNGARFDIYIPLQEAKRVSI